MDFLQYLSAWNGVGKVTAYILLLHWSDIQGFLLSSDLSFFLLWPFPEYLTVLNHRSWGHGFPSKTHCMEREKALEQVKLSDESFAFTVWFLQQALSVVKYPLHFPEQASHTQDSPRKVRDMHCKFCLFQLLKWVFYTPTVTGNWNFSLTYAGTKRELT